MNLSVDVPSAVTVGNHWGSMERGACIINSTSPVGRKIFADFSIINYTKRENGTLSKQ